MARKKKLKIPPYAKYIFIGVLVISFGFIAINRIQYLFSHVDYFKVRSVTIDPSVQFVNKRDFRGLMGKNIFTIDLKAVQRKLNYKYPQAARLKVIKRFPNQISILAKQRAPYAQLQIQSKTIVLDKEAVILSLNEGKDKKLPSIVGTKLNNPKLVLGMPLKGSDISLTLKIIKLFKANSSLASYTIKDINIENLSKIHFTLSNQLDVIIDRDKIAQKIRVLGVILAQDRLDLKDVNYVDLRFKEPIIGKK